MLLAALLVSAWYYGVFADTRETIPINGQTLNIVDGDSFSIGGRKLRLDGIDAPEYRQSCKEANNANWECGKAARAALELLLRQPGLICTAEASDKYARAIATCSTKQTADVAAAQVSSGMAISDDFYGIRSYGEEEDNARNAKRGLWMGEFLRPNEWRAANGR
jgi:endonuclease YncB( thermonuclease family)